MPSVSVLFVTYNSADVITPALRSVPEDVPVIVVDNASDDDTVDRVRALGFEPLCLPENIGYGAAANRGIRADDNPFVLLLNPDIVLAEGCIDALLAAAERHPTVGLLGPNQFRDEDGVRIDHDKPISLLVPAERTGMLLSESVQEVDFLLGSAYFIRRTAFDQIDGFDEEIFLFYEDDDFCRRLRDAGWARALVADAFCEHAVGRSSPVTPDLVFAKNWHIAWSECYARRKHGLPEPSTWSLVQMAVKVVMHMVTGNRIKRAKAWGALSGRRAFAAGIRAQTRRIARGRLIPVVW
ncbi:MAG: glycosyltransferase family 2 protein [Pseudomonadota bacterium]